MEVPELKDFMVLVEPLLLCDRGEEGSDSFSLTDFSFSSYSDSLCRAASFLSLGSSSSHRPWHWEYKRQVAATETDVWKILDYNLFKMNWMHTPQPVHFPKVLAFGWTSSIKWQISRTSVDHYPWTSNPEKTLYLFAGLADLKALILIPATWLWLV